MDALDPKGLEAAYARAEKMSPHTHICNKSALAEVIVAYLTASRSEQGEVTAPLDRPDADRIAALEQELAEVLVDRNKWYCHCENAEHEAERFKEWSERHAHRRVRAEARQWMVTEERDAWHTRAEAAEARCGQLEALASHTNWELTYGPRDESNENEDHGWRVHRRNGGVNDREWTLIGFGETPSAALSQAGAGVQPKEPRHD